jgi:hypothetical protein
MLEPGMLVYICNPSTWEAEAGRSGVQGQLELHKETMSQNNNKKFTVFFKRQVVEEEKRKKLWL